MKKAQIKMFETVGVLVIFFFLLVAGALFYFNIQKSALQKELSAQAQLRSLKSAERAVFLPELDCSFVSVQRENCFDRLKLTALHDIIAKDFNLLQYYHGVFGDMEISVRDVYPKKELNVTVYRYLPDEYARSLKSQIPVLIYDPVSKNSSFGVMEVTVYAQG